MELQGIYVQLKLGGEKATQNAPPEIGEALQSIEVTHGSQDRSGFQLTFEVGRGNADLQDYGLLTHEFLQPFNRVILLVHFGGVQSTLMDGFITNIQLSPSPDPGASTLTITGEDVSVMMDLEEEGQDYQKKTATEIVEAIAQQYQSSLGLTVTIPREARETVNSAKKKGKRKSTKSQGVTDLAYIRQLAQTYGFVFYVKPGSQPGTNEAYWGPPVRSGEPQAVLSANLGPYSNLDSIGSFQFNGLAATKVTFKGKNKKNKTKTETIDTYSRQALCRNPAEPKRKVFLGATQHKNLAKARTEAQAQVDKSFEEVVSASGDFNAIADGRILEPRALVNLRGVGHSFDGTYYVKSVTHRIDLREGEYKQSFSLNREGLGTLVQTIPISNLGGQL